MASVTLQGVSKAFGTTRVVDSVSLEIADGEFMVLVGPSGCGKSTTLRMVAGLEEATGGTIRIGARDVTRLEPRDRNVAMVFQNYALYPHKTVYDNMAFGLRMRSLERAEIERRVRRAAGILGIEALLERRPRQLSGGQQQRVALGRALVREPDVFLLDEPLSNLDAKMRVHMREEIARLHREIGTSMVYVTHDQVEAMTLGDRICVMRDGRVQQVGPPLAVYDRPANRFVAGFIGSPEMNFLDGEVVDSAFRSGGLTVALPPGVQRGPATLGVRPEHLALDPAGIPANVTLIERTGNEMLLFLEAGGVTLRALVTRDDAIEAGNTVRLRPDPAKLHLFAAEDGSRITTPDG